MDNIAEILIINKKVSFNTIRKKFKYIGSYYGKLGSNEDEIKDILNKNIFEIYNIIRKNIIEPLNIEILEDISIENLDFKRLNDFLYYGIHLEDAMHLLIALKYKEIYGDRVIFITEDDALYSIRERFREKFDIIITKANKEKILEIIKN
ncbi:hypothetical protein MJ1_0355 [Nanobdella aerobiophila]|uniref:Uncharacterized protein n=1 Tax=Nanobdella aerobiophila TaxID=2586965 RepID=A0A915WRR9_9ARCH|nr:hypothetical protein [Nanobdella aerobiophila]BBL45519.1 hypothetical protein MJ1_0355 [Nanobdella aerobiophila]